MKTKIIHATVVDGSGGDAYTGELLFEGGSITAVAPQVPGDADIVIDAAGRVLCPGFVDMHRHIDAAVFRPGFGEAELCQGITSTVGGNCGITLVPCKNEIRGVLYSVAGACVGKVPLGDTVSSFGDYMDTLARQTLPINVGVFTGTLTTRAYVKGFATTPYTDDEMALTQRLLTEALEGGALGLSMGIMFAPECFGTVDEFVRMAAPLRGTGKPLAIHMRGEGNSMVPSVREVLEIGRRADVPVHISHFKSAGAANWRKDVPEAIELIEAARATQDITLDFYPYEGSSTSVLTLLPPAWLGGNWPAAIQTLATRAGVDALKKALKIDYDGWDNFVKTLGWDRIVISALKKHPECAGSSVAELAGSGDPMEFAAQLILEEAGEIAIIVRSMCQDDIDTIARLSYASVISDALYADTDRPHPRLYGSFPKIIREYVGERGVLTLGEAVHKMTALPARRMGLKNKGELRAGFDADLLLFDPSVFRDNATFENPVHLATGLDYAILGGVTALRDGVPEQSGLGVVLRG